MQLSIRIIGYRSLFKNNIYIYIYLPLFTKIQIQQIEIKLRISQLEKIQQTFNKQTKLFL